VTYTWEEIRDVWLGSGRIVATEDEMVQEFNRVERMLGRDWMEERLTPAHGVTSHGAIFTLLIVMYGRLLASVEGLVGAELLVRKLLAGRADALSELKAAYLLKSGDPVVQLELESPVTVGRRERKPDLRVRASDEPWTYVEVTRPDTSEEGVQVQNLLDTLSRVLDVVPGRYSLEVFLRRQPEESEISALQQHVNEVCSLKDVQVVELASGLGTLYLNQFEPGFVVLDDHGESPVPRTGLAQSIMEEGEVKRSVAVRVAFSDDRADEFLRKEARQLPKGTPGLVMIDVSEASGGMRTWRPLLEKRLQPKIHTRVSGICLFRTIFYPTEQGESWRIETKLLVNRNAPMTLPPSLSSTLSRYESEEADLELS
jgi:hypothetical protein